MAYNISENLLDRLRNGLQDCKLVFRNLSNENEITVVEADITDLSINRYCSNSDGIMLGNTSAAELNVSLNNFSQKYTSAQFENTEVFVFIGASDRFVLSNDDLLQLSNGGHLLLSEGMPMGVFIVDEVRREQTTIKIIGLDRMVLFDAYADLTDTSLFTFPMTLGALTTAVCQKCGISLSTDVSTLPETSYIVNSAPDDDSLTYRRLISMIAEINGMCAFMDWFGKLTIKWFTNTSEVVTKSVRFNSEVAENAVTVTGVKIVDGQLEYIGGTEDYLLEISGNKLIQHDADTLAQRIYQRLSGFTWLPYTAEIFPSPHLYPLDKVSVEGANNDTSLHASVVTDTTFRLNMNTQIAGKGETASYKRQVIQNKTKSDQIQIDITEQKTSSAIRKSEERIEMEVTRKINAIEIGGGNMIKNSNTYDYSDYDFTH